MKKSLFCIVMMLLPILANADPEEIEINPNPTVVIVHGQERDDMGDDNHPDGTGQIWDNQFFIVANRTLNAGEVTVLEFDYVATKNAKTTTQCHVQPGVFIHWGCISDVNFTTAEQHLTKTFTVPQEANGMQSIAFNMAEIKDACDYTIKNVVWKLSDNSESLINQTGAENFFVKEGAGADIHVFEPTVPVYSQKCATPTINLVNGQIEFGCETEGVEYVSKVIVSDAKTYYSATISTPKKFKVAVYAKKANYEISDTAIAEFDFSGDTSLSGDVDGNGIVNVADHVKLSSIIMDQNE